MLNVAVTEVSLDRSGIISLVGQGITAGMPIPSVLRVHAESDIRYTQAFTVSIRLQNHLKKSETAWGEKLAPSIEVASSMIGALAAQFSIPEKCISIEIGMENYRDGTRH